MLIGAASVHLPAAPLPLSALRDGRRAAAWRVGDVADNPVATPAAAVGE